MDSQNVDLKQTVNLPNTAFPMKANLPLSRAQDCSPAGRRRTSTARFAPRAPAVPLYILHDGPPYANGRIHLGTAFNKILKDFIVKSKTMAGFDSPYVPGWDCHGLPIEIKVDQRTRLARRPRCQPAEIRRACRKYAEKYVDLQREGFQAPGRLRPLGRSLPHDERAVSVRDRRRVRRFPRPRLRLQGPQAGALVHARPHRAGRSRSRVREPHAARRSGFASR